MTRIELARSCVARVWVGDLPDAAYPVYESIDRQLSRSDGSSFKQACAAVELLIPRGAYFIHGLLGCRFRDAGHTAMITVDCSSPGERRLFRDSLVEKLDSAAVGLPCEFAEAVVEGALQKIAQRGGMPVGTLEFAVAACGTIGSSMNGFAQLARIAVGLLDSDSALDERKLADLLAQELDVSSDLRATGM